jgi:superoxide dismutase, Cu-Zn family
MKRIFCWLAAVVLLLGLSVAAAQAQEATAELQDRDGNVIGTATLTATDDGGVRVQVDIEGFDEAEGEHGIHFHEFGECEPPDFESAGDHFNPTGAEHGLLNPDGPHVGDLPNIRFDDQGNASYDVITMLVTLGEGENSLLDGDGTALVIHENRDDHVTDPSGESGDPIACGVVTAVGEDPQATAQAAPTTEAAEEVEEAEETTEEAEEETEEADAEEQRATVQVAEHETYGEYLTDGEGRALYLFLNDEQGESVCYDQCAQNWPPLLTTEDAEAGEGVDGDLLGTIERQDGSLQVTYNDWPLYYFINDAEPGDVSGQGVGEAWYLVSLEGEAIEEQE